MSVFDLIGVGAGPFNLSTAALMAPIRFKSSLFLEQNPAFSWYPGMLLPQSLLQTSFLKDLVTSADPTSPYSFLAYLAAHGRFYRFINAEYPFIERKEFADYMRWVAHQLPNLCFGQEVKYVQSHAAGFAVHSQNKIYQGKNMVVATGIQPNMPAWAQGLTGDNCIHTHHYMHKRPRVAGKHVVIVGGGQSGIEILLDIMNGHEQPASLTLLTRRQTLETLDDSPFANEFFTPDYVQAFFSIDRTHKRSMVNQQKLASDGVSASTLQQLIRQLYACDFLGYRQVRPRILPKREVVQMQLANGVYTLQAVNRFSHSQETICADVVLLSTGYAPRLPACLDDIKPDLSFDEFGFPLLNADFSVACEWRHGGKIYIQNMARYSHGIADPQLSLGAWRSATIINSLLGKRHYYVNDAGGALQWQSLPESDPAPAQNVSGSLHVLT